MSKIFTNYKPNVGWEERVSEGAYEGVGKKKAAEKNKQFRDACSEIGVEPTARQYAKWAKKIKRWKT